MGPGRVRVLCIPSPNPTRIHIILKNVQNPSSINTLFFFQISFFSAAPLSLSQALTVGHPPLLANAPLTVTASLSFTAPQPCFASRSPHSVTPPRCPLPLSLSLSFFLSRPSPSHVTLIHSPTHPSLSSRGGCCFEHGSCGG